jgi:adenylosuccinate lyase
MARMVRASAGVALENVALWHERDISHSSTERVMLPDSTILLDYMLQKMIYIVENLVVNADKMKRNIDNSLGLIFSQRVLLFMVEKGATREEAYKLVQEAAMKARDSNKQFKDIVMRDMKIRKYITTKDITEIFNLDYYIRNVGVILERVGI